MNVICALLRVYVEFVTELFVAPYSLKNWFMPSDSEVKCDKSITLNMDFDLGNDAQRLGEQERSWNCGISRPENETHGKELIEN